MPPPFDADTMKEIVANSPSRPSTREAADKIRQRLKEKKEEYQDFLRHIHMRLREEDAHAIWDAGANLSEVSNYQDGLLFALEAMGEVP